MRRSVAKHPRYEIRIARAAPPEPDANLQFASLNPPPPGTHLLAEVKHLTRHGYGMARDMLYLGVEEITGNIWLAEPVEKQ